MVTTICAAVCGMVEWDEIYFFACENKEWLQKKLKVEFLNGIPSKFTFARVISLIEPNSFSKIFTSWVQAVSIPPYIKQLNYLFFVM